MTLTGLHGGLHAAGSGIQFLVHMQILRYSDTPMLQPPRGRHLKVNIYLVRDFLTGLDTLARPLFVTTHFPQ